jgi:plasmid stabilization system protein ParE
VRLVVKSPVWEDLFSIARFIQEDNASAANVFIDQAENAFEFLTAHPHVGRIRTFSIAGLRSWRITGFENYLIFYLPGNEEVQILAVLHGARDFSGFLKDRL